MTSKNSNVQSRDKEWEIVRQLENLKAILMDIRDNLDTIKQHTLYHDLLDPEPSFDQIYDESTRGKSKIRDAEDKIIELRALLVGDIQEEEKPNLRVLRQTGND